MMESEVGNPSSQPDFARSKRQGGIIGIVGIVLIAIGLVLMMGNWVLYIGEAPDERPVYSSGFGYFLLIFGFIATFTGLGMYLYYGGEKEPTLREDQEG